MLNKVRGSTMTDEEIQALKDTNTQLVSRVTQLESINTDLVDQKKDLKEKLQTGLTDDEAKAEIQSLKSLLEGVESEKATAQSEFNSTLNSMRMKDVLREAGVNAQNSDALEALSSLVLDGASYEDGFNYKNEDGSTVYNSENKPYGVIDKVNELREGDKSYLFAPSKGGGGVTTTQEPQQNSKDIADYVRDTYSY